jgi:UrcA family protein
MDEAVKCIDSAPQPGAASALDRVPTARSDFFTPQEISMNTMTPSLSFRGLLATAAFGAFVCSLTAVCSADEPTDTLQATVGYADATLSTPQAAAALYARIQRAARQVCLPLDGRDPSSRAQMNACVHKAIGDAVAKVDRPALFAVYNTHNGQPVSVVLAATQNR